MVTRTAAAPRAKLDQVCADAVDVARAALEGEPAGDHLTVVAEGERLVTHYFESLLPGYGGWRWAVTVARAPRSRVVTICETVLLPGPEALVAPEWVPWQDRVQPGDLGVGDLMPTAPDDDRLAPGYLLSDDPAVEDVVWELGLGRPRVMSRDGRLDTAQRWYDGDHGPEAPISIAAPRSARCVGCGFYLPLAGALRQAFGVCGNVYAPDDGHVVSADHGCGAHSEVLQESPGPEELPTVYDDSEVDTVEAAQSARAEPAPVESGPVESGPVDSRPVESGEGGGGPAATAVGVVAEHDEDPGDAEADAGDAGPEPAVPGAGEE